MVEAPADYRKIESSGSERGREIFVVTMETNAVRVERAFESLGEAIGYVEKEAPKYNRVVHVGGNQFVGGATWRVSPMRLGLYPDGS